MSNINTIDTDSSGRSIPRNDVEDDLSEKTHPGFSITCETCQSTRVTIDSDVGFSAESGAWGRVRLLCLECKAETEIWKP